MRGRTAKLLRKVAKTNPYYKTPQTEEVRYKMDKRTGAMVMVACERQSYKYLKKFYKQRRYTTADLRAELG